MPKLPAILKVPAPKVIQWREEWLHELAVKVEPFFRGFKLDKYRLTCGWPSRNAMGKKVRRIGECHGARSSKGGYFELFISPLVSNSMDVAGVVCHEMAHVAAGVEAQHGKPFVRVCHHVGLTKNRPTEAAPGEILTKRLDKIIHALGQYPHEAIQPILKDKKAPTQITLVCLGCGCSVRMTIRWLEEAGLPWCGCGMRMEVKRKEDDEPE